MAERCERCDRPAVTDAEIADACPGGYGFDCEQNAIDWRARALAAEAALSPARDAAIADAVRENTAERIAAWLDDAATNCDGEPDCMGRHHSPQCSSQCDALGSAAEQIRAGQWRDLADEGQP